MLENIELDKSISEMKSNEFSVETLNPLFKTFYDFDNLNLQGKRNILFNIIDKIYFDGENIEVSLFSGVGLKVDNILSDT